MQNPQQLHLEFVKLGRVKLNFKNKMLAILPDIYKSGIWKKYAGSIVEYAGKYGDIAKTTVIKRLRLEDNLVGKPHLKAAIATAGIHKVAMMAKIATPETEQIIAEKINDMSKAAVQSLSKEIHQGNLLDYKTQPCKAVPQIKRVELDAEATFLFLKLKAKLGKHMSDKEFLKQVLEQKIKEEFPEKQVRKNTKSLTDDAFEKTGTRYVTATKKRETVAQTNEKCGYPNCNLPYTIIHHPERFSEVKNHDSLIPLCKIHHEFAHNNLIANEKSLTGDWKLSVGAVPTSRADILYRKFRREAIA